MKLASHDHLQMQNSKTDISDFFCGNYIVSKMILKQLFNNSSTFYKSFNYLLIVSDLYGKILYLLNDLIVTEICR